MKSILTRTVFSVALLAPLTAISAVNISYGDTNTTSELQAKTTIEQSKINELVVQLSDAYFPFNNDLTIQYGGDDGPLYDPQAHVVHIPYEFYTDSLNYFLNNDYQKKFGKPAKDGALDTLLHTLLHEAGHAYVADHGIAILGKEEDAVDNFAAVLMLNYVENGADATISAADMFSFESEDRPDYYDFAEYIGEHSFDLQRYFSTLCLVYGSDPESHATLLGEIEEDYREEQKDKCEMTFQQIDMNWKQVLGIKEDKS
ncbi:DUF4344 domain-containing metallopeptidase [Vibrio sp. ER1A]|uniref:DUF4344 domain-containing metallopeptidase n=1 Tax=Vibrio sp. ER1A TaxID=1517681 RepID=UPI0004DD3578|nr:DUF4344 domain-containing metallopeptidase [Vibrio sp. ER1A]KFA98639.1 hypothetical protein HW45_15065 [Vibrio sp. ER1A]